MLVAVDEVSWFDNHSSHLHRDAHLNQMDIGMGNGDTTRKEMESDLSYLIKVPNRAIGHSPHTFQGLVNVPVHLTPERAQDRSIDIVNHHHPGFRYVLPFLPQLGCR